MEKLDVKSHACDVNSSVVSELWWSHPRPLHRSRHGCTAGVLPGPTRVTPHPGLCDVRAPAGIVVKASETWDGYFHWMRSSQKIQQKPLKSKLKITKNIITSFFHFLFFFFQKKKTSCFDGECFYLWFRKVFKIRCSSYTAVRHLNNLWPGEKFTTTNKGIGNN